MLAKSAKIESPDPAAVEEELQRLIESPGLQPPSRSVIFSDTWLDML